MKIEIKCNNPPNEYKNKNLTYTQIRTNNQLMVRIQNGGSIIGEGLILDFYKKFKNKTDGKTLVFFESKDFPRTAVFTDYGLVINNIKYYKSDLSNEELDAKFAEIVDEIASSKFFKDNIKSKFTCIPSSKGIPQKIIKELSREYKINTCEVISINESSKSQAKENSIDSYQEKMPFLKERYSLAGLEKEKYIIFDDVFGTGYSLAYICNEIYNETGFSPVFICICKDVKR